MAETVEEKIANLIEASEELTTLAEKIINNGSSGGTAITGGSVDFNKAESKTPAFYVTNNTVKTLCEIAVNVNGTLYTYLEGTSVTLPTLDFGTDYAIYSTPNGLVASTNFTVPENYTEDNSRKIGGFHHQNNTINEYSFWDLKYRPKCTDPRGMVHIVAGFWSDIYLLNSSPDALGTSAYGATIADGSTPPKIPAFFGGDNLTQYDDFSWFTATQTFAAYGKRLPTQREFIILAHGATANSKNTGDPVTTKFSDNERSIFGCEQVSGHMWQWGEDRNGGYAVLLGGVWDYSSAGPLVSYWNVAPSNSNYGLSARGVCDHLELL